MRITTLQAYPLRCSLAEPFAYSQKWVTQRTAVLVKVTTDVGLVGWGEIFCHDSWPAVVALVERVFEPLVVGHDPLAIGVIWDTLYAWSRDYGQKGVTVGAISGIDIALWDILGKATDLPVSTLLGGRFREQVPCYATGLYRTGVSMEDPGPLADEAVGYVEQGYRAIKMKVGFGLPRDTEGVAVVRQAIGTDIELMVDANHAYDAATAIRLGRALAPYHIAWFEEPVVPENLEGYRAVRQALDVPIAGGEAEFTRYGFRDLISRGCVDIAQPDICLCGGLSEAIRIAALAQTWNVRCLPHVWGTGVAVAAALHLLSALPDTPPSLAASSPLYLELDRTKNPLRDQVVATPLEVSDGGMLAVPAGPGLGIEIDEDALAYHTAS